MTPEPAPLWTPAHPEPELLIHGDNLTAMRRMPDASVRMVYLDPPFNTGRAQLRRTTSHSRASAPDGESAPSPAAWQGFGGESYVRTVEALTSYDDRFADYWAFLAPRLQEAHRLLESRATSGKLLLQP